MSCLIRMLVCCKSGKRRITVYNFQPFCSNLCRFKVGCRQMSGHVNIIRGYTRHLPVSLHWHWEMYFQTSCAILHTQMNSRECCTWFGNDVKTLNRPPEKWVSMGFFVTALKFFSKWCFFMWLETLFGIFRFKCLLLHVNLNFLL